ncbi:MAG: hypothetical protein PHD76_06040 [Methylacidiphilales bacterium]|nr:hypothetical protein [Candidatus Methylacidiphilales bacterium]
MKTGILLLLFLFTGHVLLAESESERVSLILDLIPKREKFAQAGNATAAFEIDAKLIQHPAPADPDFSKLLPGSWRSPRHDYLYRKDGTWTLLPVEEGILHGRWLLKGNRIYESQGYTPANEASPAYTIILLNKDFFVRTDGKYVFYETRLK